MQVSSTNAGVQVKRYIPELDGWVKLDSGRGEAVSEVLVSEFLEACGEGDFVRYTFWQSNLQACFSKNYLGEGGF